ncbi:MAG: 1-acyl-sn-glycerol-3-phosphate acyltransferase [Lysobacterales bacterium]|jgi:glycerol-3-phosphate O-acyltransferase
MKPRAAEGAWQAELRRIATETGRPLDDIAEEAKRAGEELSSRRGAVGTWMFATLSRFVRRRAYPLPPIHDLGELERVRTAVASGGAVFLVTHKTYLDFFVLFEFFHDKGMPPPRIFGGANMAFAGFGSLARRAGGVFIRRSFRDDPVYKAVLRRRLEDLMAQGESLMWAIEGTRSRTGKLLMPRLGLLHYVTDAVRRLDVRTVSFIPVAVVYDRIPDVADMAAQETGAAKQRESISWFVSYLRNLRGAFGNVHVRFGEPIALGDTPDAPDLHAPSPASPAEALEVQKLAFEACFRINEITPATPTSLVLLSLLCRGSCALPRVEADVRALDAYITERHPDANERRPSREVGDSPAGSVEALCSAGVIEAPDGPPKGELRICPQSLSVAIYYSNMAAHHFVISAFAEIALTMLAQAGDAVTLARFETECMALRDLFKFEFFFSRKSVFRQQLGEELTRLGLGETAQPLNPGIVLDSLRSKSIRVAAGVLAPYLNAYRAVAEQLGALPADAAPRDADIVTACLEAAIHDPETRPGVSRALLANGLRVADSRALRPGPGRSGTAEKRQDFFAELDRIEAALQLLTEMNGATGER